MRRLSEVTQPVCLTEKAPHRARDHALSSLLWVALLVTHPKSAFLCLLPSSVSAGRGRCMRLCVCVCLRLALCRWFCLVRLTSPVLGSGRRSPWGGGMSRTGCILTTTPTATRPACAPSARTAPGTGASPTTCARPRMWPRCSTTAPAPTGPSARRGSWACRTCWRARGRWGEGRRPGWWAQAEARGALPGPSPGSRRLGSSYGIPAAGAGTKGAGRAESWSLPSGELDISGKHFVTD